MKIVFTDQYANLFLILNGLVVIFYFAAVQQKKQRALKFGNYETLQKVVGGSFIKSSNFVLLLRLLGISLLLIGISNPVIVREAPSTDSDYVVALDSSSSMLSSDFQPNRFSAAKDLTKSFIEKLPPKTSVGIVSFAGSASVERKLLPKNSSVDRVVENISIGDEAGTAIGDAIFTGSSLLSSSNQSRKLLLITDGRNNVGRSIQKALGFAVTNNVTINAIGIGASNRSIDTNRFLNGTYRGFPNLDTEELKNISEATEGSFKAVSSRSELDVALDEFSTSTVRNDISDEFVLLAALLLLIEWVLASSKFSVIP
ncbi:MAG: VWA domain-containing protein [Candidatus Nanohaloarchaea archaeon]